MPLQSFSYPINNQLLGCAYPWDTETNKTWPYLEEPTDLWGRQAHSLSIAQSPTNTSRKPEWRAEYRGAKRLALGGKARKAQRRGSLAFGPQGGDAHKAVKRGKRYSQQRGRSNSKRDWRAVECQGMGRSLV